MTDEQMKALVKFPRLPQDVLSQDIWDNYEQLFDNYNQELLVQICYNMNKDLDKYYNTISYPQAYKERTKILELLDKWLKSNEDERLDMHDELQSAKDAAYDAYYSDNTHETSARETSARETSARDSAISAAYYAADVAHCAVDASRETAYAAHAAQVLAGQADIRPVIIKTILDYYGEDFETFEALYL